MTAEINTLSLDELETIREKLFSIALLTRDADLSDKLYETIDLVEKNMKAKKHEWVSNYEERASSHHKFKSSWGV